MTTVFRSCLPQFYSNTNQSISNEHLLHKTNSIISLNDEQLDEDSMDSSSIRTNQNIIKSTTTTAISQLHSSSSQNELVNNNLIQEKQCKQTKISHLKNHNNTKITKKRGPCYSRINEKSKTLLTRIADTIFGDHGSNSNQNKIKQTNRTSKKSILPSKSKIKKQFEDNEQTLRSLVTLLTQIESNVKLTTTTANENHNLPIEKEEARNNNRLDDTSSSYSNDTYQHKSKAKTNHQHSSISKHYTKKSHNSKRKQSEDDTLSSSSITSHYLSQSSPSNRRKMVDNQQQTQIYPTKINTGTSTQLNNTNDTITTEPSWLDVMREDQTTINAWARIRRRLKPHQQKDILRALMIICANLFEVPIEKKHM
ncbi:unnamed protein product [Adineta steineri]|uniref:Uncharacterized protein n=1 Tax=Adineta steineri TaxID=433720 RepID=A0A814MMM3_9BILA|nr:unnamed protein product [Adineta steineri]